MHQRDICLCPPCISHIGVCEQREHERELQGRAWFEACKARKSSCVPVAVARGVVKRVSVAPPPVRVIERGPLLAPLKVHSPAETKKIFGGSLAEGLRNWAANQVPA